MPNQDDPAKARDLRASLARPETAANREISRIPERDASARGLRSEARPDSQLRPQALPTWPAEIAFLAHYGVSPSVLHNAVAAAKQQGVGADAALLAGGAVSEEHFYRSLARHLRLPFLTRNVTLAQTARYPQTVHAGVAPLADRTGMAFLVAPRGAAIANLILSTYRGDLQGRLAITTPTRFMQLLRTAFRTQIVHDGSYTLPALDPALCAKGRRWRERPVAVAGLFLLGLFAALNIAGSLSFCAILLSAALLAMVLLRLMASAASLEVVAHMPRWLADKDLPIYSIVIALYREARMVPQLLKALDKLDYPAAKLDIKFVVEEDDAETLLALKRAIRPPLHEIIIAPDGAPRTKPRALNIALPLLRGQFTTIFDAEDLPDPLQLRVAAERFARAPRKLGCLQAKLAINNIDQGWLAQLFAIEYAALFDVINVGLADLKLPFPLGGSSNHFRTNVLRKLGGWDAWNVTEDADIGFRFTRFGYRCETLASTTLEEAPTTVRGFINQRRRWCKGWYQTLGTICRDPRRLIREVGFARAFAMLVILASNVLVPLGMPLYALCLGMTLADGDLPWPSTIFEVAAATLWTSVFFGGGAALLVPILLGMKRRCLLALWPKLLLLPLYYTIISLAAWMGLFDLGMRPYHWCKTEHGIAPASRSRGSFTPLIRKAG